MTVLTPGMVSEVSATLVATMILGLVVGRMASSCSAGGSVE